MDSSTTIEHLSKLVQAFVTARDWQQFHTPKNLASSIAIETAELMEHFQWLTISESVTYLDDPAQRAEVTDEVADIFIYLLSFANSTDIDLSEAVTAKLTRNETRFPPDTLRSN